MISSSATHDDVKTNCSLVVHRQVFPIWLTRCCLLGSWGGALCCSIESLFACVKQRLQYRRTLCLEPSWPQRTQSLCHVTGISMLRVLRTVRTPHERLETESAEEHRDSDNAPAPVCSMTQLDLWPSTRENRRRLWRDPHAGGFLQGNAGRNDIHRTTSDLKPATVSSCTCGDWHERSRLACPFVLTSAENTFCRHRDKNQGCHNSTVRINTESIFRVT